MIFKDKNFNAKLLVSVIFSIVLFLTIFICGNIAKTNEPSINEEHNQIAFETKKFKLLKYQL